MLTLFVLGWGEMWKSNYFWQRYTLQNAKVICFLVRFFFKKAFVWDGQAGCNEFKPFQIILHKKIIKVHAYVILPPVHTLLNLKLWKHRSIQSFFSALHQ